MKRQVTIGNYEECDTCRKKPGSPTLCSGCLHNRHIISQLNDEIMRLTKQLQLIEDITKL